MTCVVESSCSVILTIVPHHNFTNNIFSLSLRLLATSMDLGLFEQVQAIQAAAGYTLTVGRLGGLDMSEFDANFEGLFKIIDA